MAMVFFSLVEREARAGLSCNMCHGFYWCALSISRNPLFLSCPLVSSFLLLFTLCTGVTLIRLQGSSRRTWGQMQQARQQLFRRAAKGAGPAKQTAQTGPSALPMGSLCLWLRTREHSSSSSSSSSSRGGSTCHLRRSQQA